MKTASAALKAFIPSNRQFFEADLYTLTPLGAGGSGAFATPTFVQSNQGTNVVASLPVAFTSPNAKGNTLLAFVGMNTGSATFSSLTDTLGNLWIQIGGWNTASGAEGLFWVQSCAPGTPTVTLALTGSTSCALNILEYSGVGGIRGAVSQGSANNTTPSAGPLSVTIGDLVVFGAYRPGGGDTWTVGAGFTMRSPSINQRSGVEDQIASTSSVSATMTFITGTVWTSTMCAFSPAPLSALRLTSCDRDILWQTNLYGSSGPNITRGAMKWGLGLTVDTIDVSMDADNTDTYNGVPILQALNNGVFDGARFQIDRLFGSSFGDWVDSVTLFAGNMADISELGRTRATFQVRSRLELLNNSLPFNIFQPSCRWTLYSPGCTLSKAAFGTSGTLSASSTALKLLAVLAQANGYFDLGTITFTSGLNAGISATVKTYLNGSPSSILLNVPLPNAPQTGDAFVVYAGCDKTMATCNTKFSNLIHHGGFEFIPVPESAF